MGWMNGYYWLANSRQRATVPISKYRISEIHLVIVAIVGKVRSPALGRIRIVGILPDREFDPEFFWANEIKRLMLRSFQEEFARHTIRAHRRFKPEVLRILFESAERLRIKLSGSGPFLTPINNPVLGVNRIIRIFRDGHVNDVQRGQGAPSLVFMWRGSSSPSGWSLIGRSQSPTIPPSPSSRPATHRPGFFLWEFASTMIRFVGIRHNPVLIAPYCIGIRILRRSAHFRPVLQSARGRFLQ